MNNLTVKMNDLTFDDALFQPMKTGRVVDQVLSSDGGIMPGTNIMVVGDPGVGKSTVLLDILSDVNAKGYKTLFVSGEMNSIDMCGYVKRYPKFGELDILFLSDHLDRDPKKVLENTLRQGYDLVLLDSWAEIVETLKDGESEKKSGYVSSKKIDSWLLNLVETNNKGFNSPKKFTAFLTIQQVTKMGDFAGSNRLKHAATAMFHLKFDRSGNSRYLYYSKNRRGGLSVKQFFNLDGGGAVEYTGQMAIGEEV